MGTKVGTVCVFTNAANEDDRSHGPDLCYKKKLLWGFSNISVAYFSATALAILTKSGRKVVTICDFIILENQDDWLQGPDSIL